MIELFLILLTAVYVAGLGSGATLSVLIWSWCQMDSWQAALALIAATLLWPIIGIVLIILVKREGPRQEQEMELFKDCYDEH